MSGIRGADPAGETVGTRRVPTAAALLAVLPFSVAAWLAAAATLLVDLLATPWVLWRRSRPRPPDRPPRTRDASLVVLNWNGRAFLERLLPSLEEALRAAPGNHEAIVVDNGSTDGSADLVRERFPWARLVLLPENRFFGRGISAGIEVASRDILVLLNNDMVLERDFLRALLARFDAPDLFAVTAQIRLEDPRAPRVETGKTRAFRRRGDLEWIQSPLLAKEPPLVPAFWAGGGSSAFDREKFLALGGFDPLFDPFYVEDVSLSYAAWKRGWRILFEPGSVVRHVHRGTSAAVFGRTTVDRIDRRNRHLFFWMHVTDARWVLAHALFLPWNSLKRARRTGVGLELSALLAALARLPRAWGRRVRLRAQARRDDREVLALANSVHRHRVRLGGRGGGDLRVLLLTTEGETQAAGPPGVRMEVVPIPGGAGPDADPVSDFLGLVPRAYRAHLANPAARDCVRDALADRDFDLLHVRGIEAAALARPFLEEDDLPALLEIRSLPGSATVLERAREENFLLDQVRPFRRIVCPTREGAEALRRLSRRLLVWCEDGEGSLPWPSHYREVLAEVARG